MTGLEPTIAGLIAGASAALGTAACARRRGRELLSSLECGEAPLAGLARGFLSRIGISPAGRLVRREPIARAVATAATSWRPDEIAGAKVLGLVAVAAPFLAGPIAFRPLAVPLALLAWRAPNVLLGRASRRRLARAERELPLFLDLLAVATSAGLPPQLAVRRAVDVVRGPLRDELASAIRAADLGSRWRDELGSVAERLLLPELRRTVSILTRAESLGSTLAEEVSRMASEVRRARREAAAERARTAPVKMLFPLVFLILPAFLLLTVVPILLTTVRSIG